MVTIFIFDSVTVLRQTVSDGYMLYVGTNVVLERCDGSGDSLNHHLHFALV